MVLPREDQDLSDRGRAMQSRVFLLAMFLSLAPCGNAFAQERTLAGEVSLTPAQVDIKGNRAKFNEYRDVRDGVHSHIGLHLFGDPNKFVYTEKYTLAPLQEHGPAALYCRDVGGMVWVRLVDLEYASSGPFIE
ncbi:MAG: hypothetical protein ABSB32_23120 [Thermodesulfobacteriota bacterium]